jgi:membrane-associated protease RseP (regulator of RpoE activity)
VQDHTPFPSFQSDSTGAVPARPPGPRRRAAARKAWPHVLLFILTVASTFFVGLNDGIAGALWYSGAVMAILLAHEMGHYFAARRHGVPATLPYFIPMPFSPFGTMGAVIRMSGSIPDRRALMDIGAAGPLSGLALIIPAIVIGVLKSKILPSASFGDGTLSLGDSLLFKGLARLAVGKIPEGQDLLLHPLAFAGWVGLLVTALNLLPIGQLDGGHVSYALFRGRSKAVSAVLYAALAAVCLFLYAGWILFAVLLLLVRRHPPTMDDGLPLDRKRVIIGWILLAVFILSATPVPFGFGEGLLPLLVKGIQSLIRAVL